MNMALYTVMDIKITGLTAPSEDRVAEIAVVILNEKFQVVRIFDSVVNHQLQIPWHVHHIHGIPTRVFSHAPTFEDLLPELMDCLAGTTHLIAHDFEFTRWHLCKELQRCGIQLPLLLYSASTMSLAMHRQVPGDGSLRALATAIHIPTIANNPRAIVDAGMTAKALSILLKQNSDASYDPICWANDPSSPVAKSQVLRRHPVFSMEDLSQFRLNVAPIRSIQVANAGEQTDHSATPNVNVRGVQIADSQDIEQLKRLSRIPTKRERAVQRPPALQEDGITQLRNGMTRTASWTWYEFTQGKMSVPEIARERCIGEYTVYVHLERAVRCGLLDNHQIADACLVNRIASDWYGLREENRFMKLFAAMHPEVPYGLLKCIVASLDVVRKQNKGLLASSGSALLASPVARPATPARPSSGLATRA